MWLKNFIGVVKLALSSCECQISSKFRFGQNEISEILTNSKKENIKYFEKLAAIKGMSAFDISYLMSSVDLDDNKIELLEHASKMYNDKEFCALGQTFSDFIFRVSANINLLNESNLDVFKELVQCKNELYDFTKALKDPQRAKHQKHETKLAYAFQNVFAD